MKQKAFWYLCCGLTAFFLLLIAEIVLQPAGLVANSGISYYSVSRPTIIPYLLSFWLGSFFLWRSATFLSPIKGGRPMAIALRWTATWLLALSLAPDIAHTPLATVHVVFGASVFLTEFYLATLLLRRRTDVTNALLFVLLTAAGVTAFISLVDVWQVSIEGQIIFQLAFAALLLRAVAQLPDSQ